MKRTIIFLLLLILISAVIICNYNNIMNETDEITLTALKTIELSVPEPSGLYYDQLNNSLWTVSDENSTIYNIDLTGKVLKQFAVNGLDLEGITKLNDSTLVTILERDRIVVYLDTNGIELKRIKIDITGDPNKGLEGITINPVNSHIFILNEKEPGMLLELNAKGKIIAKAKLDFTTDYSGLDFMESDNELWMISDEGEAILRLSEDGTLIKKYKVNIEQIEGLAIDEANSLIYRVSDPLEKLFVYNMK